MKRKVKIFVCYAHNNGIQAGRFIEQFKEYINPSKRYEYIFWQDKELLAGENWNDIIIKNLKKSDCGLLLLSVSFLNSKFINEVEVKKLKDLNKIIVPVPLGKINLNLHDLNGLDSCQIFKYPNIYSKELKSFSEVSGKNKQNFINKLFEELEKRLDKDLV